MASTYSTNLKIELQATGENSGTWGTITNTNLGTALEQAIVGYGNPSFASDANLTLTYTDTNAAQAARALVLNVTSAVSLTGTRELVVPTIQKQYIVQNNTTGSQSITVKTSGGTGITVPNGRKAHLYVDGTNVIQMFDFVDINGGAIDGTTVGASSASTGAFTTLTASGATTLNGAVALGDAAADLITVPGTVNSNVIFTDNTFDIGASGATRPRTGYFGTSVLSPLVTATNLQVTNIKANDGTAVAVLTDSTGATDFSKAFTLSATTQNISLGASQTTGTFVLGGTAATGAITLDQSTKAHTLNIGSGATENATTKTINIGTGGVSGSTTTITIGSSNGTTTTFNGTVNVTTLDLTNLEVTNIKAKDGTAAIVLTDSTGAVTISTALTANGGAVFNENGANVDFRVEGDTDANLIFADASADYVGIGTSSPATKTEISGASGLSTGTGTTIALRLSDTSTDGGANTWNTTQQFTAVQFYSADTSGVGATIRASIGATMETANGSGSALTFFTNSSGTPAERMRLDSSGNLGLGVAPPSGSSTPGIFMSGVTNIFGSTSNGITFAANTYRDAGVFKYVFSSTASRYSQEAGAHSWLTAPSGTANDPISFTQAMTLDASGNLLVGTTTSSNRTITVGAASASIALADANGGIYFGATGTPVGSGGFGVNAAIARAGGTNFHISGSVAGDLCIAPEGTKAILFGTSASASSVTERMRLDSSGNLGIGTSSINLASGRGVQINAPSGQDTRLKLTNADSGTGAFDGFDLGVAVTGAVNFIGWEAQPMSFFTSGTERMRLDSSGNLGIGTSSPGHRLQVFNNINGTPLAWGNATRTGYLYQDQDGVGITNGAGTAFTNGLFLSTGSNYAALYTAGNERARLDSSGNLGLGVTPSAWGGSGVKAFDIGTAAALAGSGSDAGLIANAYFNGTNWIYKTSSLAVRYQQLVGTGAHAWYIAPSGTAGDPITFTQAMTLDASGNLGVGETSPTSRLHVAFTSNSADAIIRVQQKGSNTAAGLTLSANDNNGAGYNFIRSETTGGTAHWAITGGVATSTMAFSTGGTERARITSGGYFKASNNGAYDGVSSAYHELYQSADNRAVIIANVNASATTDGVVFVRADRNTTNNTFYALSYYNAGAAAFKFRVADSGAIATAGGIALGTVTPATSGIGVQFPATQSASSDANTLDDYEEGTWTPDLGGNTTYTTQTGTYTKIGNLVFCTCQLTVNVHGTGASASIAGLPFTNANNSQLGASVGYFDSIATNVVFLTGYVNTTNIVLTSLTAAGAGTGANVIFKDGADVRVSVTYRV